MRNGLSNVLIALVLLAGMGGVLAESLVDPAINQPFIDPDFQRWQAVFENREREVFARRHEVLQYLELQPGMAVADIGAGTGFYSLLFARAVAAEGRVYAVDISRVFVENILRRARERGLGNVIGVVNNASSVGLDPDSIDLAFICDTYHHFEQPQQVLGSIFRALRPGGRLAIIDFRRIPGSSSRWIMEHVRAGRGQVAEEVTKAGFALIAQPELLRDNYFLIFRKKD